jgi:hypothetical protein
VERGDPVQEHQPDLGVVGQGGPPGHHRDQLLGPRLERQQPIEGRQRQRIVGADLEDLTPGRDRRRVIAALGLLELSQARQRQLLGRRIHRRRGPGGKGRAQLVPRAHPAPQGQEPLEDVMAGRLEAPGPGQRVERHAEVTAAALVDRGDLGEGLDLLDRIADELELGVEDDHQLLPPVAGPVHRLEEAQRALAAGRARRQALEGGQRAIGAGGGEDLLVLIEGTVEIVEVALEDVGLGQAAIDLVALVGRALDAVGAELGEVVPAPGDAVQPIEVIGGARVVETRGQAVGQLEHGAPGVDRAGRIGGALLEDRGLAGSYRSRRSTSSVSAAAMASSYRPIKAGQA